MYRGAKTVGHTTVTTTAEGRASYLIEESIDFSL